MYTQGRSTGPQCMQNQFYWRELEQARGTWRAQEGRASGKGLSVFVNRSGKAAWPRAATPSAQPTGESVIDTQVLLITVFQRRFLPISNLSRMLSTPAPEGER